eukprot:12668849-Ditylum_brightwellii.AAC.1
MNNLNYTINYTTTVFKKPELTHIHGEPTMESFLTLHNDIRGNAHGVNTTLGGGMNEHLGLVMTPTDYDLVPGTLADICPPQPTLVLPTGGTQYQITQAKEQYYDELRQFNECNAIKKKLFQQIVDAVDAKHLTAVRDPVTHQITLTIPEIIKHLFDHYSDGTAEEL